MRHTVYVSRKLDRCTRQSQRCHACLHLSRQTSAESIHQIKRFHVVKGIRLPLEAVRFLILLHVVGCWLSHLAHLLELAVNPA